MEWYILPAGRVWVDPGGPRPHELKLSADKLRRKTYPR
jgi:hypothetical protein